uniref:Venom CUB domain protein 4 n=1 Tax=Platymeris rhadamanthus TaxID=1134088 RepID=A0A6B9L698_PLARH|nr:venom CUB domain protein 4 [Platymeris rhadamanthus]
MKFLVALLLLGTLALAERRRIKTSAFLGSLPISNFLRSWHPVEFPANNDFTYILNVAEGQTVEMTCASINIEEPCGENVFRITDGDYIEDICGEKKNFIYKSKTNSLSVQLLSGVNPIKSTPQCSAKPVA